MTLVDFIPALTTTSLFALALWFGKNLIATRLTKSVQHEFDTKLELLRAELRKSEEHLKSDLREKEMEIGALRDGAMTAMANRQMALDKRRLDAVDQLWSAVTELAPAKGVSSVMASIKFDKAAEETARNPQFRQVFDVFLKGVDVTKLSTGNAEKARPFLSPMAWAIFLAYRTIALQAVLKVTILKFGIGTKDILDKDGTAKLVKAALPHHESYIDKYGDAAYHYLLDELELRLLDELKLMLSGAESDKASVAQAAEIVKQAEIVRQSNDLMAARQQVAGRGP